MTAEFEFALRAHDGVARLGLLRTAHGEARTPAFMPVGTAGTVKAMTPEMVRGLGAEIVLGNTYHLMLRPGSERIAALGGLHKFMNWPGPILTDSGGFQAMSLARLRKIDETGIAFQSHIDGARCALTPESAMDIQDQLGSDIQMQLDECVSLPCSEAEAERAMTLSLRWAERSRRAFRTAPGRAVFGIVQGGVSPKLRELSAKSLAQMDFNGLAIGGLAVGEPQAQMFATIEQLAPFLPAAKPRYLMGVGTPADILGAVARGVDMFDCVLPTRAGRHGTAYTRRGKLNLRNAVHAEDPRPLDESSDCPAARDYSRAYLHHLVKAGEILGMILLTWNNLHYFQKLMAGIRQAIALGGLADFAAEAQEGWAAGERDRAGR